MRDSLKHVSHHLIVFVVDYLIFLAHKHSNRDLRYILNTYFWGHVTSVGIPIFVFVLEVIEGKPLRIENLCEVDQRPHARPMGEMAFEYFDLLLIVNVWVLKALIVP